MNKMKRILTIVLTLALIVTMMPMNLTNVNARTTTRLSSKKIVLQVGKTKKLKVKNKPAGVKVVWKSSKKKVATVSKKGKVKAKKPGKTTITAKVGKKKYKCKVVVKRNNSIKVTKPSDNNNRVINQVTTKSEPSQIVTTKAEVKTTKTETTKKNDSTTVKPTVAPTLKPTVAPTTVAPTTANGNVDESIQAPVGLKHAPGEGLPYHFAWAPVDGADGYYLYNFGSPRHYYWALPVKFTHEGKVYHTQHPLDIRYESSSCTLDLRFYIPSDSSGSAFAFRNNITIPALWRIFIFVPLLLLLTSKRKA